MPEAYERGAIVLVQPGAAARPSGGERMSRRGLLDRLRQLGWPDVVVASAGELPALLADAGIGALVVDARGGPEAWDEVRSALLAPPGPVADDVPLLLVADDAAWPRVLDVLHRGLGDDKYAPCPLLREHVEAGRLGRKSGRGFYDYS
jgi:hypothetical protein